MAENKDNPLPSVNLVFDISRPDSSPADVMDRLYREIARRTYGGPGVAYPDDFGSRFGDPELEREIDNYLRRAVNMGLREVIAALRDSGGARQTIAALQGTVLQQQTVLARLSKAATPHAIVVQVRPSEKDGEPAKVVLNVAGRSVEVEKPKDLELALGATVRVVAESCAILDVVNDAPDAGEVVRISRVVDARRIEVDRAGTTRCVGYAGEAKEGERVVLDASGVVAVANLGKPRNDYAKPRRTGVAWDDVGGLVEAKRILREAIEAPVRHKAVYERYGKRPLRGVLLHGPSGCGKTMLGKAAATALAELHGASAAGAFFYVKGPELLDCYVGNSESNIRALFQNAREHRKENGYPAVIFLDEAEALLGARTDMGFGMNRTIVPQFLSEMDGLDESGALLLLATNLPTALDPAVVRDGRMDRRVHVGRPTKSDAEDIFRRLLQSEPLAKLGTTRLWADELELRPGVRLSDLVSGAMIAGVVDRATSLAMHREIAGEEPGLLEEDVTRAVVQTHREMLGVRHEELPHEAQRGQPAMLVAVMSGPPPAEPAGPGPSESN